MEKYYSKVEKDKLLHVVTRLGEIVNRTEIIPKDNFIQCASLKMNKGKTFRPHEHIKKKRAYNDQIAQESWIVIKGRVRCVFYDLDHEVLSTPILESGDASFTLEGGHTYEILEDDTIVYEYKTGPYEGVEFDKKFF